MNPLRTLSARLGRRLRWRPTLSLAEGSLSAVLREKWARLAPGARFQFQTTHARHEACAVLTSQGWLLEDVWRDEARDVEVFIVLKPHEGALNPQEPDWQVERTSWQGREEVGEAASLPSAPPMNSSSGRRCHVIGVSIAKSGTRSLAGLFSRYHSAHEFEAAATIRRIANREEALDQSWLHERDARSGFLECDSSQIHFWYLEEMVRAFPAARFILTIRHPRAWLDSLFNHRLARGMSPDWWPIEEARFGPRCADATGPEQLLAQLGRPTLAGALSFWAKHHQRVLETVPPARLRVLRVEQLGEKVPEIARFTGVAASSLTPEIAHQNTARARFHLLDRLEPAHLQKSLNEHCGPLWQQLQHLADNPGQ